jgi:hypothetical protein
VANPSSGFVAAIPFVFSAYSPSAATPIAATPKFKPLKGNMNE